MFIIAAITAASIGAIVYATSCIYSLIHPPADFGYQDSYFVAVHFDWLMIVAIVAVMILCFLFLNFLIRKNRRK
jgi:hypothetical protein